VNFYPLQSRKNHKEILRLTVFEGLNCPQAAKRLGITDVAARRRRSDAIKILKSTKEMKVILNEVLGARDESHD
jgi:DNA-directed RNA polymerase specialized sigma subunit